MKDDDKTASSPTSKFKSSNKLNATFWPFWNSYKGKKSQIVINIKGSVKLSAVVWNRTELRLFDLTDSELCFCLRLSFCLPVCPSESLSSAEQNKGLINAPGCVLAGSAASDVPQLQLIKKHSFTETCPVPNSVWLKKHVACSSSQMLTFCSLKPAFPVLF